MDLNKLENMWNSITYWFRRKYRQIKNVINWIPVVWNQFDFDYRYSLDVFKHQLMKQAKYMDSDNAIGVNSKYDAEKIRMICRLMDKVYKDEYACEYLDRIKQTYGEDAYDWIFEDISDKPGYKSMHWKYEVDEKYSELRNEIKSNNDKWFKESLAKQERAHKLLYTLLEFYIRRWWD